MRRVPILFLKATMRGDDHTGDLFAMPTVVHASTRKDGTVVKEHMRNQKHRVERPTAPKAAVLAETVAPKHNDSLYSDEQDQKNIGGGVDVASVRRKIDSAMDSAKGGDVKRIGVVADAFQRWSTQGRYGDLPSIVSAFIVSGELPNIADKKINPRPKRGIVVSHLAIELNVPFGEKDFAKKYGAKWHPTRKVWYYENGKSLPKELERFL